MFLQHPQPKQIPSYHYESVKSTHKAREQDDYYGDCSMPYTFYI